MTGKPKSKGSGNGKRKRGERDQPAGNKRLAEQTRKILGKHYANKYGTRR